MKLEQGTLSGNPSVVNGWEMTVPVVLAMGIIQLTCEKGNPLVFKVLITYKFSMGLMEDNIVDIRLFLTH